MLNSFQSIIFLFAYLQAYLIILIYVPQGQNHPEISMLYYPINDSRGIFHGEHMKNPRPTKRRQRRWVSMNMMKNFNVLKHWVKLAAKANSIEEFQNQISSFTQN